MSSSSEFLQYDLDVRHDDGILPDNQLPPSPNASFSFIQINLYNKFHVRLRNCSFAIPLHRQNPRDTIYLSNDWFLTKDGAERYIHCLLDDLRIPRNQQQPMADSFSSFVMGMAQDPDFANRSLLPIVLDIQANYRERYYNGIASEIRRVMMETHRREPRRAKTSIIQTLEKVEYSSVVSMEDCAICLEKFLAGRELTRLPCSHVYHRGCIVNWLMMSRLCPLCRFCID